MMKSDTNDINRNYSAFKYKTSYQVFPIQEPALQHYEHLKAKATSLIKDEDNGKSSSVLWSFEPRVFACEEATSGKRKYITTHLGRFLHHYWRFCHPSTRHFYELIREGDPCRLYFDLEYNKLANPSIDDEMNEQLLNDFIEELKIEIKTIYDLDIDRSNIVDLESSTAKKFSRHFIIHFPNGELFQDAVSCGMFVKQFVGRLASEQANGILEKNGRKFLSRYLFLNKEAIDNSKDADANDENKLNKGKEEEVNSAYESKSDLCCFVDTGVYTRNRIFRLLGSTKYGKPISAGLRIASTNEYPFPDSFSNRDFYKPKFNEKQGLKQIDDEVPTRSKEKLWDVFASVLVDTFVVPAKVDQKKSPTILPADNIKATTINLSSITTKPRYGERTSSTNISMGPSPLPMLDTFVNNILGKRKGLNGSFRSWIQSNSSSLSESTITYNMRDNRWCENIKRCHKSNNIQWVVSIRQMKYWQQCHDPECKSLSFRGEAKPLPSDIQEGINEILLQKALDIDEDFEKALANLTI